jgi:hypothetical protein
VGAEVKAKEEWITTNARRDSGQRGEAARPIEKALNRGEKGRWHWAAFGGRAFGVDAPLGFKFSY